MATTTHFLDRIMGNVFKSDTDPALPTNYYIGLSTTNPASSVTEPSGGAYARVCITSPMKLGAPSGGVITNDSSISFPTSTASWGTVTHYVIYDAATGGNLLMYNALTNSIAVGAYTNVVIRTGDLELTLSDAAS